MFAQKNLQNAEIKVASSSFPDKMGQSQEHDGVEALLSGGIVMKVSWTRESAGHISSI